LVEARIAISAIAAESLAPERLAVFPMSVATRKSDIPELSVRKDSKPSPVSHAAAPQADQAEAAAKHFF
jgi:hypothetical protein